MFIKNDSNEAQSKQPILTKLVYIGSGDEAIYNTADIVLNVIKQSSRNLVIRKLAEKILGKNGLKPYDRKGEVEAIFKYVKEKIRYTRDPHGTEWIQSPLEIIKDIERDGIAYGDCDDTTIFSLSLLKSLGYKVAIKIAAYDSFKFSHIYGLVELDNTWIPVECTKQVPLGWEAPGVSRAFISEVPI